MTDQNSPDDKFKNLISQYDKKIDNVIRQYEKNTDNIADIKQDIYFKLLKKEYYMQECFNAWAWLKTVTVNHCKNYLRDNSKFKFLDIFDNENEFNLLENIADEKANINIEINSEQTQEYIYNCVCKLSHKFREVVILYDYEELTYEQISKKIGCPVGTVKSRLFKARMILREELKDFLN